MAVKPIIYIYTLTLFLYSTTVRRIQTQEEELKNNEWYVHKVVRDGVEYLALVNEERENFYNRYLLAILQITIIFMGIFATLLV